MQPYRLLFDNNDNLPVIQCNSLNLSSFKHLHFTHQYFIFFLSMSADTFLLFSPTPRKYETLKPLVKEMIN